MDAAGESSSRDKRHKRFLTVAIDVGRWKCLVIGGGTIGTRKALRLADAGADVTIIALSLCPEAHRLVDGKRAQWRQGAYEPGMLADARLIVAATDDAELNRAICDEAQCLGILSCDVSSGADSSMIFPATIDRGELTVAVHSHGRSPRDSKALRDRIARLVIEE